MSDGTTCFTFIDNHTASSLNPNTMEGFGTIDGELTYGIAKNNIFEDFISAYPMLIKDGKPVNSSLGKEIDYKARRTVLAYNKDNIFIIAIESPGMTFSQMKTFLQTLKVDYAMNLDGGGSTKILHDGKSITSSLYNRAVDNVIAVYLKPKTIYRVQLGAFSNQDNANNFLKEIRSLSDTIGAGYKNAYVRKVGKYYKVQVGAFSIKANATRVVNDLKSKGYNAFITI